ncbi:MAG: phage portal protein [Chloroflexales bacterium]
MRLLASQFGHATGSALRSTTLNPILLELPVHTLYGLLHRYYLSNELYDDTSQALRELNQPAEHIRELRNPAHRVVEFHASKLFPGTLPSALPLLAPNKRIVPAIQKIWRWSNFTASKQLLARFAPIFGDCFLKVAERTSPLYGRQVFMQVIDPRWVTDFRLNEVGEIVFIRIDIPQFDTAYERNPLGMGGGYKRKAVMYTEVWDTDRLRIYRQPGSTIQATEKLGIPTEKDVPNELGSVPVVWAPFYDIGEGKGMGAFTHALSKIDEANRIASRLHALLFRHNNNNWVLRANQVDPTGRPMPPPRLDGLGGTNNANTTNEVMLGDDKIFRLPGQSELQSIIPAIDYNAALGILNAHMEELREDLPELGYYGAQAKSHVSGTALRAALADAADRTLEARGNIEGALVRAHGMALHLAQRAKLSGFTDIGTLVDGDFDHQFADRPVFPLTSGEQAQALMAWGQAGVPLPIALAQEGWTQEEVAEIQQAQADEQVRAAGLRHAEAVALTKLPLTDEQIAAVAVNYSKQLGVPLPVALERLGWPAAWLEKLGGAQSEAEAKAKEVQAEQQTQALDAQRQQAETQTALQMQMQAQAQQHGTALQAQKLAHEKELQDKAHAAAAQSVVPPKGTTT